MQISASARAISSRSKRIQILCSKAINQPCLLLEQIPKRRKNPSDSTKTPLIKPSSIIRRRIYFIQMRFPILDLSERRTQIHSFPRVTITTLGASSSSKLKTVGGKESWMMVFGKKVPNFECLFWLKMVSSGTGRRSAVVVAMETASWTPTNNNKWKLFL